MRALAKSGSRVVGALLALCAWAASAGPDLSLPCAMNTAALADPRTPPAITLTSPAEGTVIELAAGGTTNLVVAASASDNDGWVERVEFFGNTGSLGMRTNAPYSLVVSNLASGTYLFSAVATDNDGLCTTSAPARVTLFVDAGVPPTVAITAPAMTEEDP